MKLYQQLYVFLIYVLSSGAHAATIVDTGPGSPAGANWGLYSGQYLAAEFSLDSHTTITDIEGWMREVGGTGTIAIYSDAGQVPGAELYAATFNAGLETTGIPNWTGLTGLTWDLEAGDYWVSFEVRAGQTYSGSMQGGSTNPLSVEAFFDVDGAGWITYDLLDIGVRIEGAVAPVPAAAWLFGSGLVGLIGLARRRAVSSETIQ